MKQGLRWVALGFVVLLAGAALVWFASRMWGVRPDERAALVQMREGWEPSGRNAFAALWTLQYDVPESGQAALADADMHEIRTMPGFAEPGHRDFRSAAREYPALKPSPADQAKLCAASKPGCLAMVSADVPGYTALVDRNRRLIARIDALAGYDHVKSLLPPRLDAPLPAFGNLYASATRDALLFAQGRHGEALQSTCTSLATWRRFAGNSDMLIASMIGQAYAANGYGGLFAEMLAGLPAGIAVPEQCDAALAQLRPAELSLCQAFKGEFAYGDRIVRDLTKGPSGPGVADDPDLRWLTFDPETTSAINAGRMAEVCGARVAASIAEDRPATSSAYTPAWGSRFVCISNATGCILSDIAAPAYADYMLRTQDYGLKLKLLATLLWLHRHPHPGVALTRRLAQRPAWMQSPQRELTAIGGDRRLQLPLYEKTRDRNWSQPVRP